MIIRVVFILISTEKIRLPKLSNYEVLMYTFLWIKSVYKINDKWIVLIQKTFLKIFLYGTLNTQNILIFSVTMIYSVIELINSTLMGFNLYRGAIDFLLKGKNNF